MAASFTVAGREKTQFGFGQNGRINERVGLTTGTANTESSYELLTDLHTIEQVNITLVGAGGGSAAIIPTVDESLTSGKIANASGTSITLSWGTVAPTGYEYIISMIGY